MPSNIKTSELRKSRAKQAEKFWTKTRMNNAEPIPLREAPSSLMPKARKRAGKSKIVQPVLPSSQDMVRAQTGEVSDMTEFPYSYVGKLFMREGNSNYVGSAWIIGKRAIFTAAHCLFDDNGSFYDDVVFRPQYRNGDSPETYAIVQMSVDRRYTEFGDDYLNYDLGIGLLDRDVDEMFGIAGYSIYPTDQIGLNETVTGIGYPAAGRFDGRKMFKSTGQIVRDSQPGTTEERFFGAENDMTGGCSGGPWVDENNIAVGLNSFVFRGERPPIMHSPYFGEGFESLIEWATGEGGMGSDPDDDSQPDIDVAAIREGIDNAIAALQSVADQLPND